mmetsp:Transcript_129570/g.223891  ORF Transcript_129570/g.223891 Transcript_129570/m.223891 type:complete len:101 (-) Transcript_129570:1790-2092(-)
MKRPQSQPLVPPAGPANRSVDLVGISHAHQCAPSLPPSPSLSSVNQLVTTYQSEKFKQRRDSWGQEVQAINGDGTGNSVPFTEPHSRFRSQLPGLWCQPP